MREYFEFHADFFKESPGVPDNVHLGVTAEDQQRADERIPLLLETPAAVRFVSLEPLLGEIDLVQSGALPPSNAGEMFTGELCNDSLCKRWSRHYPGEFGCRWNPIANEGAPGSLDQVIVGAETGPGKRPMKLDWARSLRDQCQEAGVPFFFKKNSAGERTLDGVKWEQMPR